MLDHCRSLEDRAAAVYRRFAAEARQNPALCALWTGLARDEEAHSRSLVAVAHTLRPIDAERIRFEGWAEALGEVAAQLAAAEAIPPGAPPARKLLAALELERTELEAARRAILAAGGVRIGNGRSQADHAAHLAAEAARLSEDPDVRLAAALLRARALLATRRRVA